MSLWVLGKYFGMASSEDILKKLISKVDLEIAMSFQVPSYNENGSSSDTYEGSIEDQGSLSTIVPVQTTSLRERPRGRSRL